MKEKAPLQSKQDQATKKRNQAIDLYIIGEKPTEICLQLGRSRTWFYTVLAKYKTGGREALNSHSRAPHRVHNRTPLEIENAIVRTRKLIMSGEDPELRYANLGADSLAFEVERSGLQPPSRSTINRILKRNNLIKPRPKGKREQKLPDDYPWPKAEKPNQIHLFDFVTRVIVGGSRFYGCHLLDQARRWPYLDVIPSKTSLAVSQFMVAAWQKIGLPNGLYIDNDAVWRGSSFGTRTISRVVRLCLLLGIQPIFTPPYTPEANPIIESFNGIWDRNFWQRTEFLNLGHVKSEYPYFVEYCRYRRPIAAFDKCTADQRFPNFRPTLLATNFDDHLQDRLPITAGAVHFIRFVSQDGTCNILNEEWQLDPKLWSGKTVRATVNTHLQKLTVLHQPNINVAPTIVATFDYSLKEKVVPLRPNFERPPVLFWPPPKCFDC